jgi:hypothetical protein
MWVRSKAVSSVRCFLEWFIDMLHEQNELIRMQVPRAGPLLGQLRVPDISDSR